MMFTRPKVGNDVAASSQTSPQHTCPVKTLVGFKDMNWYLVYNSGGMNVTAGSKQRSLDENKEIMVLIQAKNCSDTHYTSLLDTCGVSRTRFPPSCFD